MGERKILIGGDEYISSARAAELVGYTKDYVGQLARNGKIKAKRVGRNWYIEETSINKHKLSVHYNLTKPKKPHKNVQSEVKKVPYNKNISDKKQISRINKPEIEINKDVTNYKAVSATPESDTADVVDLFPKLNKANHDVLLKSDIYFEKDKPSHTTPNKQEKIKNLDDFQSIPVRRATLGGVYRRRLKRDIPTNQHSLNSQNNFIDISQRKRNNTVKSRAHVDGILVPSRIHTHRNRPTQQELRRQQVNRPTTKKKNRPQDDIVDYSVDSTISQNEISKAIPVLGAIILFTAVVVIYILFSFS